MENKTEFIEFETNDGTRININMNIIRHIMKTDKYERVFVDGNSYYALKIGEYDRLKNELELRSKSQQQSNDSVSKLLENGIAIRLPGPRYGL